MWGHGCRDMRWIRAGKAIAPVAAATSLALIGCTSGSSSGGASPNSTATPTTSSVVATGAVLGSSRFFSGSDDRGFGTVQPRRIYNGGDGLGLVVEITWRHWGQPAAYGIGKGSALATNGGYYRKAVTVKLRAQGLGACDGNIGYGWLWVTRQRRPGANAWYPTTRWWGKQNLCQAGGGSKSP